MGLLKNTDSITAINHYISFVKRKGGDITRHKASVLTKAEGYPFSTHVGIIEGNYYTVIVEGLSNEFAIDAFKSNEYVFEYHPTNTLIIKGIKDFSNNNREIDITYAD